MREKSAWIKKYLSRPRSQETLYDYLLQQKSLSLEGRQVPLSIVTNEKRSAVHYSRKTPVVVVGLDAQQDREEVLVAALLGLAKRVLVYQTLLLASNNGLEVKRVTVRDQSKRWGSCSARKTISLNWRLLLLPTEIHDYVILHELAHLKEMNHSPRFWQALTSLDPAAREHDRQLAVLGRRIMELGRREET